MTQEIDIDESDDGYGSGGYGDGAYGDVPIAVDLSLTPVEKELEEVGTDFDTINLTWKFTEPVPPATAGVPKGKAHGMLEDCARENGGLLRAVEAHMVVESVVEYHDWVDRVEAELIIDGEVEYEWVIR